LWLAVASEDAPAAAQMIRDRWAEGIDADALACAEREVDLDAAEAACPACGAAFEPSSLRCPACGLRFG
jgi:hypothetical protein